MVANSANALFAAIFGGHPSVVLSVPGRVNLVGEHIDYHQLAVLPMAIQRSVNIAFRARSDDNIHAHSENFDRRDISTAGEQKSSPGGDWANYIKAAVQAVKTRWNITTGIDAAITADLPPAAGLSSSSALLTAVTLALLQANRINASAEELMSILPDGEHFVGTRGGGMDHAAVLASKAGSALLIDFQPLRMQQVAIPSDWRFLVAHSLVTAEKSGAVKDRYNACRIAGQSALSKLGLNSYKEAIQIHSADVLLNMAGNNALEADERETFTHVVTESARVRQAVRFLESGDRIRFGLLLQDSHRSLRDRLHVSCPSLDQLVQIATAAGAEGARLTGAGFGGCVIVVCHATKVSCIADKLVEGFYSAHPAFDAAKHLLVVQPSNGALNVQQDR